MKHERVKSKVRTPAARPVHRPSSIVHQPPATRSTTARAAARNGGWSSTIITLTHPPTHSLGWSDTVPPRATVSHRPTREDTVSPGAPTVVPPSLPRTPQCVGCLRRVGCFRRGKRAGNTRRTANTRLLAVISCSPSRTAAHRVRRAIRTSRAHRLPVGWNWSRCTPPRAGSSTDEDRAAVGR